MKEFYNWVWQEIAELPLIMFHNPFSSHKRFDLTLFFNTKRY